MNAITYSAARANLASSMDRVCNGHNPLIITRNGKPSVVMLSLEDFKSLKETAYLLCSPANALRLLSVAETLGSGKARASENPSRSNTRRGAWAGSSNGD